MIADDPFADLVSPADAKEFAKQGAQRQAAQKSQKTAASGALNKGALRTNLNKRDTDMPREGDKGAPKKNVSNIKYSAESLKEVLVEELDKIRNTRGITTKQRLDTIKQISTLVDIVDEDKVLVQIVDYSKLDTSAVDAAMDKLRQYSEMCEAVINGGQWEGSRVFHGASSN